MSIEPGQKEMVHVPGGTFRMGSTGFYPEEAPVREVAVDSFLVDRRMVTVDEFGRFANETGYVTVAERPLDPADYPDADRELLVPGSLVFRATRGPVPLDNAAAWWAYVPGASWRHPEGPGSDVAGRGRHPVTQVAFEDAEAYADWAGKALPTEAEWEYAARGGLDGAVFAWGDEVLPSGKLMANFWQGDFPWRNSGAADWRGTSPVGAFPPNGYGLYDATGNAWEWTTDFYSPRGAGADAEAEARPCCAPRNPRVDSPERSFDFGNPGAQIPRRVIKGGSHLCAPSYCLRFRPAARQAEAVDTSTSHIGFRCIVR
jgi:formylglycine-generating enzyme